MKWPVLSTGSPWLDIMLSQLAIWLGYVSRETWEVGYKNYLPIPHSFVIYLTKEMGNMDAVLIARTYGCPIHWVGHSRRDRKCSCRFEYFGSDDSDEPKGQFSVVTRRKNGDLSVEEIHRASARWQK